MMELTAQTAFTVQEAAQEYVETVDLVLLPENAGSNALRELRYPGDALPPLIYAENPDTWENFDTGPLTARPILKGDMTIDGFCLTRWAGNQKDRPVREIWKGTDSRSRMPAYFFRRLWEYFANPPVSGYITWNPKDRIDQAYNIEIESLTAGGQDAVSLDYLAVRNGFILGEVVLAFRIIGAA